MSAVDRIRKDCEANDHSNAMRHPMYRHRGVCLCGEAMYETPPDGTPPENVGVAEPPEPQGYWPVVDDNGHPLTLDADGFVPVYGCPDCGAIWNADDLHDEDCGAVARLDGEASR